MSEKTGLMERLYRRFAVWEDRRCGGIAVDGRRETRFQFQGAEAVQSSDYRCLRAIFRGLHFTERDVLADVGCGEGRVLTWLAMRRFPGRLIGVELDPDAAETAKKRTQGLKRCEIRCGSILNENALMQEATVYYLFNPFNGKIFSKFIMMLEKECQYPVTLLYLFDYYGGYLEGRPGWTKQREVAVRRPGQDDGHGTVWSFDPQGK